jgi:hypothetical protein
MVAQFDKPSGSAKMALLNSLLNLRCAESLMDYGSSYNVLVGRLKAMGEDFGKDLLVAVFFRGLPQTYGYLVAMLKLRATLPPVEEVIAMVIMHSQI